MTYTRTPVAELLTGQTFEYGQRGELRTVTSIDIRTLSSGRIITVIVGTAEQTDIVFSPDAHVTVIDRSVIVPADHYSLHSIDCARHADDDARCSKDCIARSNAVNDDDAPAPASNDYADAIADRVLDAHAIKPEWKRSGAQMRELLAEAAREGYALGAGLALMAGGSR